MRQIVLDTETTGLDPKNGHRIIEVGCVELIDRQLTGNNFHVYINPERLVDAGALAVHGISNAFLKDKPLFKNIGEQLFNYLEGGELIIHNAPFDVGFLDREFKLVHKDWAGVMQMFSVIDTLTMARERHPRQKNNLDALCKRYHIDNSKRDLHGALLDAEILALVYLAMTGGQSCLFVEEDSSVATIEETAQSTINQEKHREKKLPIINATAEELAAHQAYISKLSDAKGESCLWERMDIYPPHAK